MFLFRPKNICRYAGIDVFLLFSETIIGGNMVDIFGGTSTLAGDGLLVKLKFIDSIHCINIHINKLMKFRVYIAFFLAAG